MIDKKSDNWKNLPWVLKCWFVINFLQARPTRKSASRIEITGHISGFVFCCLGLVSESALVGGIIMLATAYLYRGLIWQGDEYGIWYDYKPSKHS